MTDQLEAEAREWVSTNCGWADDMDSGDIKHSCKQAFLAGAAAGAERGARWIPVSERLPGVNQVVALCDKFGEYWCGQLRSDGNIYYNFGRELVWGKEFTHWMPLPEPPKEGK